MLPPDEYRTVKQPEGSRLCGACVVAMAVGRDLVYATDRMPAVIHKGDGRPYYRERAMYAFLASEGIIPGLVLFAPGLNAWEGRVLAECGEIDIPFKIDGMPAIVAVESTTFPDGGHWVFWDGKVVRDPSPKVPDETWLDRYQIHQWSPLLYLDEREELP